MYHSELKVSRSALRAFSGQLFRAILTDMIGFNRAEAQLFRILVAVFGEDNVVPNMRVIALCNSATSGQACALNVELLAWAENNRCLFTIVNSVSNPCLVIEFFSGFGQGIVDPVEHEHQRYLKPILADLGIHYVTISDQEFADIIDPDSGFDIVALLRDKVDLGEEAF